MNDSLASSPSNMLKEHVLALSCESTRGPQHDEINSMPVEPVGAGEFPFRRLL